MSETMRRVAITGLGCITPIGTGIDRLWEGLQAERSAVRPVDRFDASPFRTRIAAAVDDFDPADHMDRSRVKRLDRFAQFAVGAARMALDDAGLNPSAIDPDRVTVHMGSALGGVAYAEDQLPRFLERGVRGVDPLLALSVFGGSASCNIAIEFGFTGENITNGMSCASGAIAIGEGWRRVRSGEADAAVVGGAEAPLSQLCFGSFAIIRAMSTRNDDPEHASRPFDADRDGFVMAEGAAVLILEEMKSARARGARIYAELAGYGSTSDAYHMTAPLPNGRQAARAVRSALATAGMAPEEIEYVNAHGSSTPLNDSTESAVIREVLGDAADTALVSATKGYHGHALGATGAMEAVITARVMRDGWIPPTLNLERPGDGCDLSYVRPGGAFRTVRAALSNSFGFGGVNAVLAFRHPDVRMEPPQG